MSEVSEVKKQIKKEGVLIREHETINIKVKDENCVFSEYSYDKNDMLNSDLANYLEEKATNVPKKSKLRVKFFLLEGGINANNIKLAYKEKFKKKFKECDKKIRNLDIYAIICFFVGVLLIFLSAPISGINYIQENLHEVFNIIAWVFTWEAVQAFFIKRVMYVEERKKMARLYNADIIIFNAYNKRNRKAAEKTEETQSAPQEQEKAAKK